MNADVRKPFRNLILLLGRITNARHLLAVAQRLVIDSQFTRIREVKVASEVAGISYQPLDRLAQKVAHNSYYTPPSLLRTAKRPPRVTSRNAKLG